MEANESARFSYVCMCLLIRSIKSPWYLVSWSLKCPIIKIAALRTTKALDRATSGRRPRDERGKKEPQ